MKITVQEFTTLNELVELVTELDATGQLPCYCNDETVICDHCKIRNRLNVIKTARQPKFITYFAKGSEAIRNGSYYRKEGNMIAHYRLGDYQGDVTDIPAGLAPYTPAEFNLLKAC